VKVIRTLVALSPLFILASEPAHADTDVKYEIRAAEVNPDAVQITEGAHNASVSLLVRLKAIGRFAGNVAACEAAIDFGDGSPLERAIIGKSGGTSNINEIPHVYSKPGTYSIRVAGTRSTLACAGRANAEAVVLGPNDTLTSAPNASAAQGSKADRNAGSPPSVANGKPKKRSGTVYFWESVDTDDFTLEQRSPCPPGWELVPKSNSAQYRFQCRQAPVKPIACQGGTTYFENGGLIGCK